MASKTVLLLGFLLATVILITSEVTARDVVETSAFKETTHEQANNAVEDAKYGGGGYGGGPGGGYGGGGGPGGGYGGGPGGGYGGGGGRPCRYRCCDHGYYGRCRRCCSYEEAMEKGN